MTEPSPTPARPRALPARPRALPTVLASVACFLVLFEFLAFQLGAGKDPALGSTPATEPAAVKRPTVIDRKIVETRVVSLPPKPTATSAAAAPTSAAPSSTASAAPAVPAPVAAAPAPTPAPAPAPAPAAPVTSSS